MASSTSITATTPAHGGGNRNVVVTNTDNQSGTLANGFTYANPAPAVTAVVPNSGPVAGGTAVTITGTNFLAGATVSFGGTAATNVTVASSTSITATTPAVAAGAVNVVVTNSDKLNGALNNGYTYTAAPDFNITAATLAPGTIAPGGSASSSITITPLNGFTGDVTLSCGAVTPAVNPPPTCAFSPSSMAGPGVSTLTVHTTAATQAYLVATSQGRLVRHVAADRRIAVARPRSYAGQQEALPLADRRPAVFERDLPGILRRRQFDSGGKQRRQCGSGHTGWNLQRHRYRDRRIADPHRDCHSHGKLTTAGPARASATPVLDLLPVRRLSAPVVFASGCEERPIKIAAEAPAARSETHVQRSPLTGEQRRPKYSIIIPAYNEGARLGATLATVLAYVEKRRWDAEIIVVDDGSSDNTVEIVRGYAKTNAGLQLLQNPGNRGKGYSIRNGMLHGRGEILLFSDADLSSPIEEAEKLFAAIAERRGRRHWLALAEL